MVKSCEYSYQDLHALVHNNNSTTMHFHSQQNLQALVCDIELLKIELPFYLKILQMQKSHCENNNAVVVNVIIQPFYHKKPLCYVRHYV